MDDTSPEFAARFAAHHAAMTPTERMRATSDLFETARQIVESSLPAGLSGEERRRRWAKRMYGDELPATLIEAYAKGRGKQPA